MPPELAKLAITTRFLVRTFSEVGEGESCVSASSLLLNRPRGRLTSCLQRRAPRQARPSCPMVRVKPAGVSLSVWRLKNSQSKNVVIITIRCGGSAPWSVLHTPAMDYDDAFSDGSVATCDVNTTRRARCSRRSRCSGALRDFQKEERCTARGRRYHVYLSPTGMQFVSRVAALRAVQCYWSNTSSDEGF